MAGQVKSGGGETGAGLDGPYRFFPFGQPFAWGHKFSEPIACETVIALPINSGLFPAHAVGFGAPFASEHAVLEQSLLLLYLQACLHAKPTAVVVSSAFTTEEYARLGQDCDARADMTPRRQTLFLIPMTTEMLSDALTYINERVRPPPPPTDKEKFVRRTPTENIAAGIANKNAIRSPTALAKAVQALINDSVKDIEFLLTTPNIAVDAETIASSPEYAGHILHYCNAERQIAGHGGPIVSETGTPVPFQNKPSNYFRVENDQVLFEPIEELDEYGCIRTLNALDQAMLFGDVPDANRLLRMHFPTMQAPWRAVKSLIRRVVESKMAKLNVDDIHPRSLVINGLTAREIEHGDCDTEVGRIVVREADLPTKRRFPDPQQTAMLKEQLQDDAQIGVDRNTYLTQIGYPAQHRLQETHTKLLEDARREPEETRLAEVCNVYKVAFQQLNDVLSDPTNNLFPASLNKLYRERMAIDERLHAMRLKQQQFFNDVRRMIIIDESTRNFGGDTNARLLQHLCLVLSLRLGAMSNQIYPMLMGLLLVWNMIISYDNNKHAAALIGTPASGKSQMWEWIVAMMNGCLFELMGDQSQMAENYTDKSKLDFVLRLWDEKSGLGSDRTSKDMSDSRQGATLKTMLAEGYVTSHKPEKVTVNGRETLQSVVTITPARGTSIFLRNTRGKDGGSNPIESRLHNVQVNDPPTEEHQDALLGNSASKRVLEILGAAGQAIGTQQLLLHLPGHAGLDTGCDQSLLSIAMAVYLLEGLQPPLGRQLKQVRRLIHSVTCHRVAGELTRLGEFRDRFEHFEEWELSFVAQCHMVSSPSDIIAGMALYYGCAGQDSAWDDVMQTLVALLQRSYTSASADGDDGGTSASAPQLTGFETHKSTHYVLTRCGNAKQLSGRPEEMLGALTSRIYNVTRGRNGGETASQPVIRQLLEDLLNYHTDGEPALTMVEYTDEKTKSTELRFAIAFNILHTASSLPHIQKIVSNIAKLQDLRMHKKPTRADLYSPDEEFWIIPLYSSDEPIYAGNLIVAPHEFINFPNTRMKAMALDLISAGSTSTKRGTKMKAADYDHQFRFLERMYAEHFQVTTSNQTQACRKVDPAMNRSLPLSEDGSYALEPVTVSGQCLKIRISKFQEIVTNEERPSAFKRASNKVRAIMMPPEALDPATMTRYWAGLQRNKTSGKMESIYLEPEDLSDVSVTMRDLTFRKETPETEAFLGKFSEDGETERHDPLWPGTSRMCTFRFGDDKYRQVLDAVAKKKGLVGEGAEQYRVYSYLQCRPPSRKRTHDAEDHR